MTNQFNSGAPVPIYLCCQSVKDSV